MREHRQARSNPSFYVWGVSEKRARMAYTAGMYVHFFSSQNATALAAATFRESTPCDMGIFTV